jgi:hypothetical protein
MRVVPDWSIQTSWWISGIFATGAVWYFLSTKEYGFAVAAAATAGVFAGLAIFLHRKKDSLSVSPSLEPSVPHMTVAPVEKDKTVTSQWWKASDLRQEYESKGLTTFRWSNADRVPEREAEGYEVVRFIDSNNNVHHRIVNKSGQVLIARA